MVFRRHLRRWPRRAHHRLVCRAPLRPELWRRGAAAYEESRAIPLPRSARPQRDRDDFASRRQASWPMHSTPSEPRRSRVAPIRSKSTSQEIGWIATRTATYLHVATPAMDGKTPLTANLRFRPASDTTPFERDLGGPGSSHICGCSRRRIAQSRARSSESASRQLMFRGRGYHDHNAGEIEISRAIRRWQWGRVHHGPFTDIYYRAEPHHGASQSLRITCREGCPESVRAPIDIQRE